MFTGETLPDGRTADAVYIVLHDFYREILDHALTRPLDYDYLKDLPPAAQRLYEVMSYALFAALKNDRPRRGWPTPSSAGWRPDAALRVGAGPQADGEDPRPAPQVRLPRRGGVRGDDRPRGPAGLDDGVRTGAEGQGRAPGVHHAGWSGGAAIEPPPAPPSHAAGRGRAARARADGPGAELVARGVTRAVAAELVRDFPEDRIRHQIEVVDWLRETKPKRIKDLGAYLADAIRKDFAAPAGFKSRAERAEAEATARARAGPAGAGPPGEGPRQAERARIQAYWAELTPDERQRLDAAALAEADPADRAAYEAATAPVRRLLQVGLRDALIRRLLGLPAAD